MPPSLRLDPLLHLCRVVYNGRARLDFARELLRIAGIHLAHERDGIHERIEVAPAFGDDLGVLSLLFFERSASLL